MTLDPVHIEGIAKLAAGIAPDVDEREHRDRAETVWKEFLDPLYGDDGVILEPLDEQARRRVSLDDVALQDDVFPTRHGVDSGTINPTTYRNGVVMDVAQAAMAAIPTDLDVHRSRTVVATVHHNDETVAFVEDWETFDDGFARQRVLKAPSVHRYAEGVVHALALYYAESEHALRHADDVTDVLYLDGPMYPKGLLMWRDRHPDLERLLREAAPTAILQRYVDIVEHFAERRVPLVGFVKNPASHAIVTALRDRGFSPWPDDAAFFTQILERFEDHGGEPTRVTDELTFTNWFISRGGVDRAFSAGNDPGVDLDLARDPADYEVTFFAIYDPRDDLLFRVEAPAWVTRDEELRDAVTMQALKDVAVGRGPPEAIARADSLARIDADGKETLRRRIEDGFDSERVRTYDDHRWGDIDH